jgi:hypothetical protein
VLVARDFHIIEEIVLRPDYDQLKSSET